MASNTIRDLPVVHSWPEPSDITIGQIRVLILNSRLVVLERNDHEICLVPAEAIALARHLLEQFGATS